MKIQQYEKTNLYIVEVENNEAGNVFDEVNAFFSTNLDFEKIRLLGIFEEFEDFESVKQFVQHMQVDHSKVTRLEKYAAISNQRWLAQVLEFENKLVPKIPFRFFKNGKKQKAIDWLLSEVN
jgi:hypothetical protein